MQHGLDFYAANDDESQVTHRYQLKEYGCYTFELTSIEEPVCFDALEPVSWPSSMWSKRRKVTTTIFLPTSSSVALLSFFWFTFLYEFFSPHSSIGWEPRQDLQEQEAALIERWKGGRNSQTQGTFAFDWYILFFFSLSFDRFLDLYLFRGIWLVFMIFANFGIPSKPRWFCRWRYVLLVETCCVQWYHDGWFVFPFVFDAFVAIEL